MPLSPQHHNQGVVVVELAGQVLFEGLGDLLDHVGWGSERFGIQQHGVEAFGTKGLPAGVVDEPAASVYAAMPPLRMETASCPNTWKVQ